MKLFFKIIAIFVLMQSFQCSDSNELSNTITSAQLDAKKTEIQNYINSFSCSESAGCGFIAFGDKPCGGPRTFLLFPNTVDLTKLKKMVEDYNEMDNAYNIQTNAISDCTVPAPPTEVKCVNGVCTIIK